jgi:hypothetical protein
MAINNIATTVRNGMADVFVDAIDVGTTDATGDLAGYSAAFASLLFENNFSNPAFGAAAVGVATANAISDDVSANNTGTAAVGRLRNRDNTTVAEFTITATGGGGDLQLNTLAVTAGDRIGISSATVTMPAS